VLLISHTVTNALDPLWRFWPVPFLLVSLYFSGHIEPDVKLKYPTWLGSWSDPSTVVHRIISIGGVIGSLVELGILHLGWRQMALLLVLPAGLVISAALFYSHHHPGENPDIRRQHEIMATAQLLAGGYAWRRSAMGDSSFRKCLAVDDGGSWVPLCVLYGARPAAGGRPLRASLTGLVPVFRTGGADPDTIKQTYIAVAKPSHDAEQIAERWLS